MRDACRRLDLASFREGHLTPVYFGSALEEFRRRRPARRPGRARAAAARAGGGPSQSRGGRARHERLRVQDPGEHGPQPPRPHRVRAHLLGPAHARHEGQAGAHRQADEPAHAAFLLRPGPRARRRGVRGRRGRHSQPRRAAHRRHAHGRRGAFLRRRAVVRAGDFAPRAAHRQDEGEEAQAGAATSSPRRASCRCSVRTTARPRSSAWSARCSSTC